LPRDGRPVLVVEVDRVEQLAVDVELEPAQQDTVVYLAPQDTLVTLTHPMGGLVAEHTLVAGQTLFSLAKFYGISTRELYAYNPHVTSSYRPGDVVLLPLPLKAIVRQVPPPLMLEGMAPVYYRIRRGDTVFGICNRSFEIEQAWLQYLNPSVLVTGLAPGELLHIGWITPQPIPQEWHEFTGSPYARMNQPMKLAYMQRSAARRIRSQRGAATWPQDLPPEDDGFFCLHRNAPINSYVEVYNPLTRWTIYLKVSGRLPERVYDNSTLVVISPLAAKALGAKDNRFYVHLNHY
ncbi:MAG: LysM peptidoglycan-binding domain-containing protein, partial [Bacteroidota bacterium]